MLCVLPVVVRSTGLRAILEGAGLMDQTRASASRWRLASPDVADVAGRRRFAGRAARRRNLAQPALK
jgi:hypothetical protein